MLFNIYTDNNNMANFEANGGFIKHDDYMTPKSAWADIQHIIPKDKVIWEAFYGDGASGNYLKELGFNVIHQPIDFFENDLGEVVVSNPPFSKCPEIFERLKSLNKPFILILPVSKLNTQYTRRIFAGNNDLQIVIPRKRIQFVKHVEGRGVVSKNSCAFDCFYYCYKIGLPNAMTWL
jgi:hypothetical protein